MSPSAVNYRADAERCRRLANACHSVHDAARWRKLAGEYDALAQGFEAFHSEVMAADPAAG